jgi:hypothetical protein
MAAETMASHASGAIAAIMSRVRRAAPTPIATPRRPARRRGAALAWLAATIFACSAGAEVRIHVAPDGSDTADGGTVSPVATLPRAQSLARAALAAMREGSRPREPVRVLLGPGTYRLSAPLLLTPEDSGTARAPFSIEAATAGTAVISGGQLLARRAEPAVPLPPGGAIAFALPVDAPDVARTGGQVFVDGVRATLAREPDEGREWFVRRSVALAEEPGGERGHEAFGTAEAARRWLGALAPQQRERAIVQVLHAWNTSQHRIAAFDPERAVLRLAPRSKWAFLSSGFSQRWFVENAMAAMNAPGEWLAHESELHYLPRSGQQAAGAQAVLALLPRLIEVRGDARAGRWVEHVQLRGLEFAHTRWSFPDRGFVDPQAALDVGAALEVDAARHVAVEDCRFGRTAGWAVWLRSAVTDSRIVDSRFADLGAGGIQVGVARQGPRDTEATARIEVRNNRIEGTGAAFPGAVAVWVGQALDVRVAHNLIRDTSYSGISVGWTWGFGPAHSGRHRIENNLLADIGRGRLSDQGAIYTLGALRGTTIRGNVIREVRGFAGYGPGPGLGSWGIYNDEGTSDIVVEDNIVVGTDTGGYHLNKGLNVLVRGKVFAGGDVAEVRISQAHEGQRQLVFEDNLVVPAAAGRAFDALAREPHASLVGNRVAEGAGTRAVGVVGRDALRGLSFTGLDKPTLEHLKTVLDAAGPTAPGAPAATLARPRARSETAPPLPLERIDLSAGLAGLPPQLNLRAGNRPQAIAVVDDAAAPEGRCLRLTDSPEQRNLFDPHLFARLNHTQGRPHTAFSIRIDEQTDFVHEWREGSVPYRTGPMLRITAAGGVTVGGRTLAPAPAGRWIAVRASAGVGADSTGSWELSLRVDGGPERVFRALPPVSPSWRELHYAGWHSMGGRDSTLCLADIEVGNTRQLQ